LGQTYEVSDDSGFLGIFDPDAYVSFVDPNWTLEQLFGHFREQMLRERLLLWGTGREGWWTVEVEDMPSDRAGFREIVGPITASAGRLCLTNYESLTMGAAFAQVALPEPHHIRLLLPVPAGQYNCRIIQLAPPLADPVEEGSDFVVQLWRADQPAEPWRVVPWAQEELPGNSG
jgi:hypothetical protein